jgi:hypothetical protein
MDVGCGTLSVSTLIVRPGESPMPGSHWMIVMSPENFEITRERGFDVVGLKSRHRKKAERMALGDRILFYVAGSQVFPLTATVTSTFFEDHSAIWVSTERRPDVSPWRVQIRPDVVLHWYEHLDARQIAPRLLYVKRWAPEDWPLAFQGQIHLLSSQDFALIEHEMRRTIDRRHRRRERPPQRPRSLASIAAGPGGLLGAPTGPVGPANDGAEADGEGRVDDRGMVSLRAPVG